MANESDKRRKPDSPEAEHPSRHVLQGVLTVLGVMILMVSLASFRLDEMGWEALNQVKPVTPGTSNVMGLLGLYLGGIFYWIYGLGAWVLCVVLLWLGTYRILHKRQIPVVMLYASGACVLAACICLSVQDWIGGTWASEHQIYGLGGALGHLFGTCFLVQFLGYAGAFILAFVCYILSIIYLMGTNPVAASKAFVREVKRWVSAWKEKKRVAQEAKRLRVAEEAKAWGRKVEEASIATMSPRQEKPLEERAPTPVKPPRPRKRTGDPLENLDELPAALDALPTRPLPEPTIHDATQSPKVAQGQGSIPHFSGHFSEPSSPESQSYILPSFDILHYEEAPPEQSESDKMELLYTQKHIVDTLKSFGVEVTAGNITKGPTITRYEIYPSQGLRVAAITRLEQDLARATKAERINILAPIPGKDTVGIEIANTNKIAVALRELLQDAAFSDPKKRIPLALGKDVYGNTVIGDLAAMPHLLVAGATGSGKSVCINSIITSILYKFRPDELRFILVDPKVVEMQPYSRLPHLIVPVVTDPKRVIGALRWLVNEMERRYRIFAECGVRNFESFNKRPRPDLEPSIPISQKDPEPEESDEELADAVARYLEGEGEDPSDEAVWEQGDLPLGEDDDIPDRFPYIVIIIDELADLMQTAPADMEGYISRLTQKARAAGIHLIVATQTPRSDVVTGLIKANIPCRISFQVSSALDSRIILDKNGAEKLVGKGDLLYLPPGSAKLERAQGAYISDDEVEALVEHCAQYGKQDFHAGIQESMEGGSEEGDYSADDADEEILQRCIEVVRVERKASTSLLQRRLRIGYGKAARMIELMERRGVVSPSEGSNRPREVLIP